MTKRIFSAAALCAGILAVAAPGQAADTTTTFTITAGGLSISAPASKSLGSVATGSSSVSAQLGSVTVTDERGALLGSWTATVSATDFTTGGATANETIAKANASYWSGAATATTGTATFTPGQANAGAAQTLASSRTAFAASAAVGNNSATWNPTVTVTIPSAAVSGTYSGTITHSVA